MEGRPDGVAGPVLAWMFCLSLSMRHLVLLLAALADPRLVLESRQWLGRVLRVWGAEALLRVVLPARLPLKQSIPPARALKT